MAAPTYTWAFVCDLWGDRVPKIATLAAYSGMYAKKGTLLYMYSGDVRQATASVASIIGLAAEDIDVAATDQDPIKVELLFPGAVIKGTADADASALSGFSGKLGDLNTDGSLDVTDATNGCLAVWKTEDSGLTVYCVATQFDMGCIN